MRLPSLPSLTLLLLATPLAFALPITDAIHDVVDRAIVKRFYGVYSGYLNYGNPGDVKGSSAGTGLSGFGQYKGYGGGYPRLSARLSEEDAAESDGEEANVVERGAGAYFKPGKQNAERDLPKSFGSYSGYNGYLGYRDLKKEYRSSAIGRYHCRY